MNALDSPLEALAFNYLSYGLLTAVNCIWTWVAVITAAVSFWRIKAQSSPSSSSSMVVEITSEQPRGEIRDGSSPVVLNASPMERIVSEPAELLQSASTTSFIETTSSPAEGTTTKGKFTMYYYSEDEESESGDSFYREDNGGDECGGGVVEEYWWGRWERVMSMKMGDEEWYSYQDLTAINGNVVRLWDNCRRRNATSLE